MGVVYLAEQTVPVRRQVALKMVRQGAMHSQANARFEAERQAMARLQHPNVAQLFEAGSTSEGDPYFVMELVPGEQITDYCDGRRLGIRARIELFQRVCDGVQHAHEKGLLHRDLKPSNILVTETESGPTPKVLDFGVAKAIDQPLVEGSLFTGEQIVGTPAYLSPEAVEMAGTAFDLDTRSDVYSLGVLLYELLVGVRPFETKGIPFVQILRQVTEGEPTGPSTRWRALDDSSRAELASSRRLDETTFPKRLRGDLDWIVLKAIATDRAERYPSAASLAADLERHLRDEPVEAGPPTARYRLGKFVRRRRGFVIAAAALLLSLVLGLTGTLVNLERAQSEAERANRQAAATQQALEETDEIAEFLQGLFEVSDPGTARGNTITARELLDRGATRARTDLQSRPLTRARFMLTIGNVYTKLGLYEEAQELLQETVATREQVLGPDHPEVAAALSDLGWLAYLRRNDAAAEAYGQRALGILEAAPEPDRREISDVLNSLGLAYWAQGRDDEAEPLFQRSLKISEELAGPEAPIVAAGLTNLGVLYFTQRRFEEAEPLFRRSLAIEEKELGSDHPEVALSLNNLGEAVRELGDREEAESNFRRALAIYHQAVGPDHPDYGMALANLGGILREGDPGEAETALLEAVRNYEGNFTSDHPWLASPLHDLGLLYRDQGRLEEAESSLRRALAIRQSQSDDWETAETARALAALLRSTGRHQEAQSLENSVQ